MEWDFTKDSPAEIFFRQLMIIYFFINYRLDRPMLKDKHWPEFCQILEKELQKCLAQKEIPEDWLEPMFWSDSEEAKIRKEKYNNCRQPLSFEAEREIKKVLDKIAGIKSANKSNKELKSELEKIRNWALSKMWEITHILGYQNI